MHEFEKKKQPYDKKWTDQTDDNHDGIFDITNRHLKTSLLRQHWQNFTTETNQLTITNNDITLSTTK